MALSEQEKSALLELARRTLLVHLRDGTTPPAEAPTEGMRQPAGAFVTLHEGERLRGCIGTFVSDDPLVETVQSMAIAAATRDPRFPGVTAAEVAGLTLEISVLSPLQAGRAEDVEVGTHGVYITRGHRRGVLLPQVATDHGWDRETFLDHTCLKAGLPPGTWREEGTLIELFTAEVFGEH